MEQQVLTREMALRIGLAARALPDVTPRAMLAAVERLVGLPPSEERLRAMRIRDLREVFEDAAKHEIAAALAYLKGEAVADSAPPPETEAPAGGEGAFLVACASTSGEAVDGHFGSCPRFLVYEVGPDAVRLVDVRPAPPEGAGIDGSEARAELIADCKVVFVTSIGGPAAAKVVKRGLHPVKITEAGNARALAATLSGRLKANPPPWMARLPEAVSA